MRGGEKFQQALKDISGKLTDAKLKVGFLEGSTYPDGTPVPLVAAVQNFGSSSRGIPPRPFFSNMIREKKTGWAPAIAKNLKANDYDVKKTLNQAGEAIAGQLRQSIVDTNAPPLKPATIARKGFEKPLVDTGHMLNSVDYEVDAK